MKVAFTSLSSMSENLKIIRANDLTNIKIIKLHPDAIPYLDCFIDDCQSFGCSVSINKQLLADLDILEHFSDRVQIH